MRNGMMNYNVIWFEANLSETVCSLQPRPPTNSIFNQLILLLPPYSDSLDVH